MVVPFVGDPTGQFSNHLLERFRKIYELKAVIPVQLLLPAILPGKLKVALSLYLYSLAGLFLTILHCNYPFPFP